MGYGTRNNGQITTFWPDDTDDCFYLNGSSGYSFGDILEKAKQKWGENISLSDIAIEAEHIQTDCLFDRYDSSDWTDFIAVRKGQ